MYEKLGYLKEDYKIFVLNDCENRDFKFHYHDFYKLIVFVKGHVLYNIEGKTYELKAGDIVLVPKNEIHKPTVFNDEDYDRIVLYLSKDFLEREMVLKECFDKAHMEHVNVMRLTASDFRSVHEKLMSASSLEKSDSPYERLKGKLFVTESLIVINESVHDKGLLFDGNVSYDRKIVDICEYINNHINEDLSVDTLAGLFYISKYHFMRQFKEYTGVTVHNYVLEKRLLQARQLIENGEKISVAAVMAGFKDYSTYLKAKKRVTLHSTFEENEK